MGFAGSFHFVESQGFGAFLLSLSVLVEIVFVQNTIVFAQIKNCVSSALTQLEMFIKFFVQITLPIKV